MINQIQDDTGAEITHRGRRHDLHRRDRRPERRGRPGDDQRASPTRRCPRSASATSARSSRRPNFGAFVSLLPGQGRPAAHLASCASSPAASGSRTSRTSSRSARRSRSRSPRSTTAASSRWSRSIEGDERGRADADGEPTPTSSAEPSSTAHGRTLASRARQRPGTPHAAPARTAAALVRRTVLPGGLRVVTEAMPGRPLGRRSASGSASARATRPPRQPAPRTSSSTCCSRARPRRDALDISAALDAVGGEINAFTAKEYTCFYARVLDDDLPLAVDVSATW